MRDGPTTVENPLCCDGKLNPEKFLGVPTTPDVPKKSRRMNLTRKGAKKAKAELQGDVDGLVTQKADLEGMIILMKQELAEIDDVKE